MDQKEVSFEVVFVLRLALATQQNHLYNLGRVYLRNDFSLDQWFWRRCRLKVLFYQAAVAKLHTYMYI